MSELTIRLLHPQDSLEELTALLHRAYAELAMAGMHFVASRQSIATTQRRVSEGECWVATVEDRLVGTIVWVRPHPDHRVKYYQSPDVAHFGQFAVDPDLRHAGIGRSLLMKAESRAAEEGFTSLALDTSDQATDLIALYAHWGYRTVDRHDWRPGVNYESVVMAKDIHPGGLVDGNPGDLWVR